MLHDNGFRQPWGRIYQKMNTKLLVHEDDQGAGDKKGFEIEC